MLHSPALRRSYSPTLPLLSSPYKGEGLVATRSMWQSLAQTFVIGEYGVYRAFQPCRIFDMVGFETPVMV